MATVKYQQKIHKAFADALLEDYMGELREALADRPKLLASMKPQPFDYPEVDAVLSDSATLCEFFAVKSEEGEGLEFDSVRSKSVKQTVKANIAYYKNVRDFVEQEDVEEYKTIYAAIKKQLEAYFDIAAEDILEDVYGESYTELKARITAEEEERQAARVEARKKNAEKKAEGNAE